MSEVSPAPSTSVPAVPTPGRGRSIGLVAAILTTVHALSVVLQPIAIGGYLNGNPSGLSWHEVNATVADALALVCLVVVIIAALRARWGPQPIAMMSVLFVLEVVQTVFGYSLQLAIHVPLGVLVVGLAIGVPIRIWGLVRGGRAGGAAATPEVPGR